MLPYSTRALDALEQTAVAKSRRERCHCDRNDSYARLWQAVQRSFPDLRNINPAFPGSRTVLSSSGADSDTGVVPYIIGARELMAHPTGESESDVVRLDFNRHLMLRFRGSVVKSDTGLLAYREQDDALNLTEMAGETLADARTGRHARHTLVGLLRQSVFGRLAGYESTSAF
jgi:hypothetical protein